jgi:hypothetical protein
MRPFGSRRDEWCIIQNGVFKVAEDFVMLSTMPGARDFNIPDGRRRKSLRGCLRKLAAADFVADKSQSIVFLDEPAAISGHLKPVRPRSFAG